MAINNYPFIKTEYLKTYAMPTISKNVDDTALVPYIFEAQSIYLMPVLGSKYFNDLKTRGLSNSLTADEQILVEDYIQPFVLKYTVVLLLEDGASVISNKGVQERNSTFSNPMSQNEIMAKASKVRNRAEESRARLVKYLCDNYLKFNLTSTEVQNIERSFQKYTSPIYFGPGWDNESEYDLRDRRNRNRNFY